MAIDIYRMQNGGRLPDGLWVLTLESPVTGTPYVERIPEDPWGNDYVYEVLGRGDYELSSSGPDWEPGTDDDIHWPER